MFGKRHLGGRNAVKNLEGGILNDFGEGPERVPTRFYVFQKLWRLGDINPRKSEQDQKHYFDIYAIQ